jgi:acetylornithine deacetylase/succinyl-diaminopimelate desuccinylase-like protein
MCMTSRRQSLGALDPVSLLQRLIRFDTTNPPGNEAACIEDIQQILADAGIPSQTVARDPARPNLIARLKGRGEAPPFLMYGHVDVVPTAGQVWDYPPFSGEIADGFIWGRGALDCKGGIAMMITALARARSEGLTPPGDILFAALADEEAGAEYGAKFLVEEHPELFANVRYAIGEFGGFTMEFAGTTLMPIMIAEKQTCAVKLTVHGAGGHGSMPVRGGSMMELAQVLRTLDRNRLPVHITPEARIMFEAMGDALGGATGLVMRQLLNPVLTDPLLSLLGEKARLLSPLLHNSVSATMLQGSPVINVIPDEIAVGLDGRLLPGQRAEDLIRELGELLGPSVTLEVVHAIEPPAPTDMGLFDTLAGILRESNPEASPIPYMLAGATDGRFFARLGIQTYGFLPMQLPPDFKFTEVIHTGNERIPVDAVVFGADAMYRLLQRLPAG